MPQNAVIIDAATRFLRSNPELLQFARRGAGETGQGVEDLLTDAVRRIRREVCRYGSPSRRTRPGNAC